MLQVEFGLAKNEVIERAQADLLEYLAECKREGAPVLLCLSGGSALELIKNGFDFNTLGSHVTVTVLDERFTTNPKHSNMAQLFECGFAQKAIEAGCQLIDTRVKEGEDINSVAGGFALAIERWSNGNPNGKIVATIGMGDDVHTAGIIPSADNFRAILDPKLQKLVVGYHVGTQPVETQERITTTFNFLAMVAYGVMVVMGEKKIPAMQALMAREGDKLVSPARIWRETKGIIKCYTDLPEEICRKEE